jgi:hypothetical protein
MPIKTRPRPPRAILPPPETREVASAPWSSPPPPLAVNARMLTSHGGPCPACSWAMLSRERVADLTGTGETVHVACITRLAQLPGGESAGLSAR